jgi:hypothetical protein
MICSAHADSYLPIAPDVKLDTQDQTNRTFRARIGKAQTLTEGQARAGPACLEFASKTTYLGMLWFSLQ